MLTLVQASFSNPTQIFADDVVEEKGENARLSAFVGAIAVGDLVKSTLGPKGMDKILQSAYVAIDQTSDGTEILMKWAAGQVNRRHPGNKRRCDNLEIYCVG